MPGLTTLLDFSDHRIIAIFTCLAIIFVSLIAIITRYFVHRRRQN